jgi:hypothetical protein
LTPAELRKKAKEQEHDGLCDPANLEVFIVWHLFGGAQRGLSPVEVMEMPATLRADFSLIMQYVSEERDKVKKAKPPKPRGRR